MRISTRVLPQGMLNALKRSRAIYAISRNARFAVGSRMGARPVQGLGRAHYNDFMLSSTSPEKVESYRRGAVQFVDLLEKALTTADRDWASVVDCLEIGCGYGRIVRELSRRLPGERIHVCDVIDEGARFTAIEFGAHREPLIERAVLPSGGAYDLIYLLSVYTHLTRDFVQTNLSRVEQALRPGGLVMFTIHGQGSADTAERYDQYWLDKSAVLNGMVRDGYYYERYPYYYDEYGLTWFTKPAVERLVAAAAPGLELLSYEPMALDGHQDVYVYRKR